MINNNNKEQWIESVLESTRGMNRAQPSRDLFEKISDRLNAPRATIAIAFPWKQWAAAAILILAFNIGSIIYSAERTSKYNDTNATSPIAAQLELESVYNY